ncbi:MAG: hypothetical protein K1X75_15575 [Leptospirales bacterium]|nr:hypothetical protein [Leptospirales bacterium]
MDASLLIAGAGQLGSRYLQGLVTAPASIHCTVLDPSEEALRQAKIRWQEAGGDKTAHKIVYTTQAKNAPKIVDLAVVATTANVRANTVVQIANRTTVRYWVLEKVLAQRPSDLDILHQATNGGQRTWVNTPMLSWTLYKNLRFEIPQDRTLHWRYEDVRGLACNAIHYLDLASRWHEASLESMSTDELIGQWSPSTRTGFYDVYGSLHFNFSNGSSLLVSSKEHDRQFRCSLSYENLVWKIHESDGIAECSDGRIVRGRCELQSELTTPLIMSLLERDACLLPTLDQSIKQHVAYLSALLVHYRATMDASADFVPIT